MMESPTGLCVQLMAEGMNRDAGSTNCVRKGTSVARKFICLHPRCSLLLCTQAGEWPTCSVYLALALRGGGAQ